MKVTKGSISSATYSTVMKFSENSSVQGCGSKLVRQIGEWKILSNQQDLSSAEYIQHHRIGDCTRFIRSIFPGDVSWTVISIENATVNVYNSVTPNVGKSSSIKLNQIVEAAVHLYNTTSSGNASYNLSHIIDFGSTNCFSDIPEENLNCINFFYFYFRSQHFFYF